MIQYIETSRPLLQNQDEMKKLKKKICKLPEHCYLMSHAKNNKLTK